MRIRFCLLLALVPFVSAQHAEGVDFAPGSAFDSSIPSFPPQNFQARHGRRRFGRAFHHQRTGATGGSRNRQPVAAKAISSCDVLWSDETHAMVLVSAEPPIVATKAVVGVLFFLARDHGHWKIADQVRFVATGKYAEVSAELTAGVGSGYQLGSENMNPVITVKESQGGRVTHDLSGSYTFAGRKLKRLELK